jgi:hypothetical protein
MKERNMTGPLLPQEHHIPEVHGDASHATAHVVATRDHDLIRRWAAERQAEPATGEATGSGDATIDVKDGGAGIRFNFPGLARFRPISWDEWFGNFDAHHLLFVYEPETGQHQLGTRYRIVKADDWKGFIG